jgi:hypothetical protein
VRKFNGIYIVETRAERYSRTAAQKIRIYYQDIGLVDDLPETVLFSDFDHLSPEAVELFRWRLHEAV